MAQVSTFYMLTGLCNNLIEKVAPQKITQKPSELSLFVLSGHKLLLRLL